MRLSISDETYEYIVHLLNLNGEVMGQFIVDGNELKIIKETLSEGGNNCRVKPNFRDDQVPEFIFHTHPFSCHNDIGHGWPSGGDLVATLKYARNGNKLHLIFDTTGIYSLQITGDVPVNTNLKKLARKLDKAPKDDSEECRKEYLKWVNDIGLFRVKFVEWKDSGFFII
jgi:hypothetical protein